MTFIACAAMLASAVAFTGCKGDQNAPQQKAPEVTTDITISLPANATGGARRMPGTAVQVDNGSSDFQGIKNICLIPFGLAKNDTVMAEHKKLGAKLTNIGNIEATSELAAVSKAKKYTTAVPTGTSAFLFYAESNASGTNFEKGSLTYVEATTTANTTKFDLGPIVANASVVTGHAAHTKLLAYVQSVADAVDENDIAWKNYTDAQNEGFRMLFDTYKTTKNLNSFNIQRMMNDLLATISLNENTLANNMRAAIKNEAYVTYDDGTKKVTLKSDDNLNNFPACLNLPDGSVSIAYDPDNKTFGTSVDKSFVDKTTSSNMQMAPVELYTYPASLWYYSNTTIYTSNESENAALTDATHDWSWVLGQYLTANGAVNSSTRSIALKKPINYAVGRFDVQVKLGSANLNDAALPTAAAIECNNDGKQFTLTAVLVGGQKNVGFNFSPETYPAATPSPVYTIYDKIMTTNPFKITTTYGSTNSTLVLETSNAGTEADNVMIAIELVNNTGVDFVGADGVIPAGGKFYLVGKLLASAATETGRRVFKKDYITKAELSIGDLTKAYNGIPDLRTPTLEIGLSVDLQWVAGHTYQLEL